MSYTRRRYRARRARLPMGDDVAAVTPTDGSTLASETTDLNRKMLATQQNTLAWLQAAESRAKLQKWVQIAATLSIPLAGAIWRVILGRRRSSL